MALVRVAQYGSVPGPVTDYQAQNAHLQAFTNQLMTQQFILDSGTAQPVIKQGCYVSHGGSLYVADADTAITGSPSDGSVYIRVSGTTTLTVEFVNNISGYTWNPVYTALTSGNYTLLPYLIVKASTVWTRYNFNPNNQSFGAIKATSVDTGSGAMTFDQGVKTTDSPTFASINTGHGANELYPMNQAVRSTDSPTFAKLKLTTSTSGSQDITSKGSWVVPVGIYQMAESSSSVYIEVYTGSGWTVRGSQLGAVISDGSNVRIYNNDSSTRTAYYRKFS